MKILVLTVSALFSTSVLAIPTGAINPGVTQANIKKTICKPNWTKTIRPPSSYTTKLKIKQIKEGRFSDTRTASYEEDHLISLQLGGSPDNKDNLWPQPYAGKCGARVKDKIEGKLKRLICSGDITLTQAQKEISRDWVKAYNSHIGKLVCD